LFEQFDGIFGHEERFFGQMRGFGAGKSNGDWKLHSGK